MVEVENDGRIPYLGLQLVRHINQTVKTEWYMKPIASGRFLNYYSAHSMKQKVNVATNFIQRVNTFSINIDEPTIHQIILSQLNTWGN